MKTKSEIFKQAHQLAKQFEGHYSIRISCALRIIYQEINLVKSIELSEMAKHELKKVIDYNHCFCLFTSSFEVGKELEKFAYKSWDIKVGIELGTELFFNQFIGQNLMNYVRN